ncbi:type III ribulose-bisphosphate carboxylase [Ammonifex thiophilus]|uniref:Type III ribulose-bisphosphate carboxylase n=1 Tax=Ammonifex thiophilus TaxID=444093 RepID=A0A3D8P4S6_9THEO|nr:type III ribulose-bisphosphate carboxylase [Ammonifex thiophilus]RDV84240.1 type III ribulose-bisphosphate carboxylase [Ammonifex thiophilus]
MRYSDFVELNYTPSPSDCLACFYVEPAEGVDIYEAAGAVASESSIGTWTDVATMKPRIWEELRARVYAIEGNIVRIAYPVALFEPGNIPQYLSSVAGNVFGMKAVKNLRLLDLSFPPELVSGSQGPAFGVQGVREILGVHGRPLVGTIVKPKLGLDPREQAEVVYEALVGGLDLVKDDENLTSQPFSPFEERVKRSLEACARAEAETGEKKVYLPNVTAETEEMIRRAELVKREGGRYVMVDIVTAGFSGLLSLRKANLGLIIHAHRAMYASFARNKRHGIAMLVLAKLARLAGVDQLHIGTVVGKMEGDREDVLRCHAALGNASPVSGDLLRPQDWGSIKPVLSVASGGLHPGHIPDLISIFGVDCVLQFGGGVHGHPQGTRAGASAVRAAVEAATGGQNFQEVVRREKTLEEAIMHWGG